MKMLINDGEVEDGEANTVEDETWRQDAHRAGRLMRVTLRYGSTRGYSYVRTRTLR